MKVEIVELEKVVRTGGKKTGTWQEKIDRTKLAEILEQICIKAEELKGEAAVKFSGVEFLQEIGAMPEGRKKGEEAKLTTVNSRVNEIVRKIGSECGIWDKSRYRLVTKIGDNDVECFVSLKKKVVREKEKQKE